MRSIEKDMARDQLLAKNFNVLDKHIEIVCPATKTPTRNIYLSDIDLSHGGFENMLMTFEAMRGNEDDPGEVLRDALSKALVYFYPLAGRIEHGQARPRNICNGQGALFAKANADCTLCDIAYLNHPFRVDSQSLRSLLLLEMPHPTKLGGFPLLRVQVTRFKCGGFGVGIGVCGMVVDGTSHSNFIKYWAQIARAKNTVPSPPPPNPLPVWDGRLIPRGGNSSTKFIDMVGSTSLMPYSLCSVAFSVTHDGILRLKRKAESESLRNVKSCTTFEAVAAIVWRAFMKTTKFQSKGFYFAANARKVLKRSPPEGYSGKCTIPLVVYVDSNEEFSGVVTAIRMAKERLSEDYFRSYMDYLSAPKELKNGPKWFDTMMGFQDWTRFEYVADFGWGEALHIFPFPLLMPETFILPSNNKHKGTRVLTSLPAEALPQFKMDLEEMEGVEDIHSSFMSLDVCPMPCICCLQALLPTFNPQYYY